jgi:hypothetical protein
MHFLVWRYVISHAVVFVLRHFWSTEFDTLRIEYGEYYFMFVLCVLVWIMVLQGKQMPTYINKSKFVAWTMHEIDLLAMIFYLQEY